MKLDLAMPTVSRVVYRTVQNHPSRIAIIDGRQRTTYAELWDQSSVLARKLIAFGAKKTDVIALILERRADAIAMILACARLGCPYVAIDPSWPEERMQLIVNDCSAKLILTNIEDRKEAQFVNTNCLTAATDYEGMNQFDASDQQLPLYLIYTSGTTGKPKGCAVCNHNVSSLIDATTDLFQFTNTDVWSWFHTLSFDLSVWEIWTPLAHGSTISVVPFATTKLPAAYIQLAVQHKTTVLTLTPTALRQVFAQVDVQQIRQLTNLRYVILGGEACDQLLYRNWFRYAPHTAKLFNMYGLTEDTVHTTVLHVTSEHVDPRDAGVPLKNKCVTIRDELGIQCPSTTSGEIWVGGCGLVSGYLNRPDLTQSRFRFDTTSGETDVWYKSGDLGFIGNDSHLYVLGRIDQQLKINGFRVEPGEILSQLQHRAEIMDAWITVSTTNGRSKMILHINGTDCDTQRIDALLRQRLPSYLIPSQIVITSECKTTLNGKRVTS